MCDRKACILKYLRIGFYIVTIGIMWYIPAKKIIDIEAPETPPLTVDFDVMGYDPYDPARGHYLAIQIAPIQIKDMQYQYRKTYYAMIKQGRNGMAEITEVKSTQPVKGKYVRCKIGSRWAQKANKTYAESFPWNRFYINEELARPAEKILQKTQKGRRLRVKIFDGGGSAVEDLLIDGKSIRELAKEQLKKKK